VPILDPGTGVQYLQIAIPSIRISKIRGELPPLQIRSMVNYGGKSLNTVLEWWRIEGGGALEYAYGWLRVRSPWGILHQVGGGGSSSSSSSS